MLIDSHCHLDFPDFAAGRDDVVERARAAGLKRIITISTRADAFAKISRIAETYPDVFCTVGTHPHYAHEEAEVPQDRLVELARHPKCVGIGEAGLDYHYDKTPRAVAARVFRTHIAAARQSGLPIVIHARDADADIAAILRDEMGKGAFAGLLHCFTGSAMLAEVALSLGLYISFSGVLTFKNSRAAAGNRPRGANGQGIGRNGRALFGAGSLPGQAQRTGICRRHRPNIGRCERRLGANNRRGNERQCAALVCQNACSRGRRGSGVSLTFTILGCGSSGGVPRVGQGWGACDPNNPKNRRRRCSIFVERTGENGATTQVLVDMSPDLREQLLGLGIGRLDAILLTHSHADHIHGIDEIRPLVLMAKRKIDLYMDAATAAIVRANFGYIFETPPGSHYPPLLNEHRLLTDQTITINGPGGPLDAVPFQVEHGEINALGFRFGKVAYSPDLNAIPDRARGFWRGSTCGSSTLYAYAAPQSFFLAGNP